MRNSIRKRLIVTFLGIALLPLMLIGGILTFLAYDNQTEQAAELQNQVADATMSRILLSFGQLQESLHLAVEHLSLGDPFEHQHDSILLELFELHTEIENLILTSPQGEVQQIYSRSDSDDEQLDSMAGRPEFQTPLATGENYFSGIKFAGQSEIPLVTLGMPVLNREENELLGVLIIHYRVGEAIDQALGGHSTENGHMLLVSETGSGLILAQSDPAWITEGSRFSLPEPTADQIQLDTGSFLIGQEEASLGELDLIVIAGRPLNAALELAINSASLAIIITLSICLLAVYVSMWLVRRIVEPIEDLSTAVEQVQHGNLEQSVAIENEEDEIGRLGKAFNLMTRQLRTTLRGLETEIAERHQTELQLRESQTQFQSLFNTMNQGVVFRDVTGAVRDANPSALEIVGLRADQIERRYKGKLRFPVLNSEGQPLAIEDLPSSVALNTGQRVDNVTLAVYNESSREYRWLVVDAVPLFKEGEPVAHQVYSIFKDVTDERKREESLRHSQKMESLGMLAGGIAHDFNNLLVAMMGQTSLALRKLPQDHSAHKHVEKALKAAEHASNLTRQLLDYSGQGILQVKPLDLNKLLNENLHLFRVAIPKNVELESHLRADLPLVAADAGHLQQVAMNLIINAAQAIGDKAGRVTVVTDFQQIAGDEAKYTRITNQPLAPGQYATFEVHDNGHGMSEEKIQRIFDPFFTTKQSGRGLGLAATLGIVRGHKGAISVYSELGKGTTFKILLPVAEAQEAQPKLSKLQPATAIPRNGRILIIDDETAVAEAAKDILDTEGFSVTIADGGEAGLNAFKEEQDDFQLILLDLTMPGMSGEETFRQLRTMSDSIPILLTSGYNQIEATRQFSGQVPSGFIQKPYTAMHLVETVCDQLSRSASQSGLQDNGS